MDRTENEEIQAGGLTATSALASGSRMGTGLDSGSSAPSSAQHSLATSREEEDDEESSSRPSGQSGSRYDFNPPKHTFFTSVPKSRLMIWELVLD